MNLTHLHNLQFTYKRFQLKDKQPKYLIVLYTVYDQQQELHRTHTHGIDYRIVNSSAAYTANVAKIERTVFRIGWFE